MSDLLKAQQQFAQQVAMLIRAAYVRGYNVTLGDAYRDPRCPYGHPQSLHRSRLAIDLNLFRGESYLQGEEADAGHRELHALWETLGGARMIENDANHYSFAWEGMR